MQDAKSGADMLMFKYNKDAIMIVLS